MLIEERQVLGAQYNIQPYGFNAFVGNMPPMMNGYAGGYAAPPVMSSRSSYDRNAPQDVRNFFFGLAF